MSGAQHTWSYIWAPYMALGLFQKGTYHYFDSLSLWFSFGSWGKQWCPHQLAISLAALSSAVLMCLKTLLHLPWVTPKSSQRAEAGCLGSWTTEMALAGPRVGQVAVVIVVGATFFSAASFLSLCWPMCVCRIPGRLSSQVSLGI